MESYPSDFADSVSALAKAAGSWAALQAVEDGAAEDKMAEVEEHYQTLCELNVYEEDPVQIKDMACAAGAVTAARMLRDGEGLEDQQQGFQDAVNPTPGQVSEALWQRTQKLCWASARMACAEQQGDDATSRSAGREFARHARCLAGFGSGRGPVDREAFAARAKEVMPATVVMFSGCMDSQTSADVYNTASFGLPEDAGPGGAGGACTNSMIKALLEKDDYSWVGLLQAMHGILEGRYTQIPQLSSSRPMDLNGPFQLTNPESSGRYRALLIGINYVGTKSELRGCHNDVQTMTRYLRDHGYGDGDMRILCDDGEHASPSKESIEAGMSWLVEGSAAGDSLFLHYSGHGASVRDDDGDEPDGKDECLVPVDYESAGLLRDDDVFKLVVAPLPEGVQLTCVLDCCHSGTILDLPYMFKADDGSLAAVEDGSFSTMQENPNFDFGKVLQIIHDHPVLAAAAVLAGGVAFACMGEENRSKVGGVVLSMAKSFFSG